jgi:membrane protease YdiL (CAAX protease family)
MTQQHASVEIAAILSAIGPAGKPDTASVKPLALWTFLALTFGATWSLWLAGAGLRLQSPRIFTALFLIAGFVPSLAALLTVWVYDGALGLRVWGQRCLAWRLNPGWYAAAFFGPLLAIVLALALDLALGGILGPSPAAGHVGLSLAQFGLVLVIGGPLGEEFGWRGYALPALTRRWGWRWASLSVGAVWGLWHLPLFYMSGTAQAQMPMALFMTSAVALAVVFARMSVNTGFSVLPALALHWAINAWPGLVPIIPANGNIRPYALVMGLLFLAAAALFLKPGPPAKQGNAPAGPKAIPVPLP